MPANPMYFRRLPEIMKTLQAFSGEFLDRATIEKLFGVRRRTAINLMHKCGGYQVGRTFLISRQQLIAALEKLAAGDAAQVEIERKQRVADLLDEAYMKTVQNRLKVAIAPRTEAVLLDSLTNVHLGPHELRIAFEDEVELYEKLALLSQALLSDPDGVSKRLGRRSVLYRFWV